MQALCWVLEKQRWTWWMWSLHQETQICSMDMSRESPEGVFVALPGISLIYNLSFNTFTTTASDKTESWEKSSLAVMGHLWHKCHHFLASFHARLPICKNIPRAAPLEHLLRGTVEWEEVGWFETTSAFSLDYMLVWCGLDGTDGGLGGSQLKLYANVYRCCINNCQS